MSLHKIPRPFKDQEAGFAQVVARMKLRGLVKVVGVPATTRIVKGAVTEPIYSSTCTHCTSRDTPLKGGKCPRCGAQRAVRVAVAEGRATLPRSPKQVTARQEPRPTMGGRTSS